MPTQMPVMLTSSDEDIKAAIIKNASTDTVETNEKNRTSSKKRKM